MKATPKMVKRFSLSGVFRGLSVCERFENKHEAESRREVIEGLQEEYELSIAEVEVPEEL